MTLIAGDDKWFIFFFLFPALPQQSWYPWGNTSTWHLALSASCKIYCTDCHIHDLLHLCLTGVSEFPKKTQAVSQLFLFIVRFGAWSGAEQPTESHCMNQFILNWTCCSKILPLHKFLKFLSPAPLPPFGLMGWGGKRRGHHIAPINSDRAGFDPPQAGIWRNIPAVRHSLCCCASQKPGGKTWQAAGQEGQRRNFVTGDPGSDIIPFPCFSIPWVQVTQRNCGFPIIKGRCPCSWQGSWNYMVFSKSSHSVILWSVPPYLA